MYNQDIGFRAWSLPVVVIITEETTTGHINFFFFLFFFFFLLFFGSSFTSNGSSSTSYEVIRWIINVLPTGAAAPTLGFKRISAMSFSPRNLAKSIGQ